MSIGYATVTLEWDGPGSPGTNTWHLRSTGSDFATGEEMGDLMAGAVQQFYADADAVLRTGLIISWDGQINGLGTDLGDTNNTGDPWTLTVGNNEEDAAEALCIVAGWRTGSGGRRGRGRSFIGPLARQAFENNGVLSLGAAQIVQDAADTLVASSDGFANGAVVVYSPTDGLARDVTSAAVSNQYGVLRSRRD